MNDENYKKVILRLEDGEDVYVETPWVIDLGNGRYRMDNCPFYFYGVTAGDIIGAEYSEVEGGLLFSGVLEKSGNKLVRIFFENPSDVESPEKDHLDLLVSMGCSYEGANPKYICIDIPKNVDLFKVCNYLTKHEIQWEHVAPTYSELYPDEA